MRTKKSQFMELQSIAVTLAVFIVVIVVGFLIMGQMKEQAVEHISSGSVTSESLTWSNNTYVQPAASSSYASLSCSHMSNGTGGIVIGSGNYTCNINGIRLLDGAGYGWNTTVLVNYTYKNASYAYNGTGTVQGAVDDLAGWTPLIITIGVAVVILGMVLVFRRR